jgi:hypothetical protein
LRTRAGFAVLIREAMRAGKPGASPSSMRLPNRGGALVAAKIRKRPQVRLGK